MFFFSVKNLLDAKLTAHPWSFQPHDENEVPEFFTYTDAIPHHPHKATRTE